MDVTIAKKLLSDCLGSGKRIRHKYLGLIKVVSVDEEQFEADTPAGVLPFLYDDLDKFITTPAERVSENSKPSETHDPQMIPQTYDASLYTKKRRTNFPANALSSSQQRHAQNSTKKLR